jgi:hypothetical protein
VCNSFYHHTMFYFTVSTPELIPMQTNRVHLRVLWQVKPRRLVSRGPGQPYPLGCRKYGNCGTEAFFSKCFLEEEYYVTN